MAIGKVEVVFECVRGFVTDMGEGVTLTTPAGHRIVFHRYGVWKMDRSRGKYQVVMVTDELPDAIREASQ